jgi:hypothetical protein
LLDQIGLARLAALGPGEEDVVDTTPYGSASGRMGNCSSRALSRWQSTSGRTTPCRHTGLAVNDSELALFFAVSLSWSPRLLRLASIASVRRVLPMSNFSVGILRGAHEDQNPPDQFVRFMSLFLALSFASSAGPLDKPLRFPYGGRTIRVGTRMAFGYGADGDGTQGRRGNDGQ